MVKVEQIAFENSLKNYSYLLNWSCGQKEYLACIDPFDGQIIADYLDQKNLGLDLVLNTHQHYDHIRGNGLLCEKFNCPALGKIDSEYFPLQSMPTPGHTQEHVCFWIEQADESHYFLGDTLFEGGVGNCKNGGDPKILYETIERLINKISLKSIIWVGHNYANTNEKFSQWILGGELKNDHSLMPMTWEHQLKNNIFLKIFDAEFRLQLRSKRADLFSDCQSCQDFFLKLRSLRDRWS